MEVCNSYGRRNNENLMLDYGFALLGNEWDFCEVGVSLQHLTKYEELVANSLTRFPISKFNGIFNGCLTHH